MSSKTLLVGALASSVAACAASATAQGVQVMLLGARPELTAGRAWTARLVVRPASFRGSVRLTATGPTRIVVRARRGRGSYRARLVFPSAGRWALSARAGASISHLGTVQVRELASEPLRFVWPTAVDVEPNGSLLLVENGLQRLWRIDPSTGRTAEIASLTKPYSVKERSGSIFVTDGPLLRRIDGAGPPVTVATASGDIGPIAIASGGDIYFTTADAIWKLVGGTGAPVRIAPTAHVSSPHGLAIAADGALLVADTDNDRILRVDPTSGVVTEFAQLTVPRGLEVAGDGTIFVVDGGANRVVHLGASGAHIGLVGPVFDDPYDLAVAPSGALYVVESLQSGDVRRIGTNGVVTTVSRRR
ncbi:MAG: hypothetical protein C5B48_15390 [Candidatus Rokuibacteriota bacterium]|nr:MAG: hypothetical protein C5B48_15390 [Candidatus Rokubacteria bacterium]